MVIGTGKEDLERKACPKLPVFLGWMSNGQAWGMEMGERKGRAEEQRHRVYQGQQGILELNFRGSRMSKDDIFWT